MKDFNPSVVGLTGTDEEVQKVLRDYKAYAAKQEIKKEGEGHADHNYMVNHSSLIYVMGKDGKYVTHFSLDDTEKKMVETLNTQLQ